VEGKKGTKEGTDAGEILHHFRFPCLIQCERKRKKGGMLKRGGGGGGGGKGCEYFVFCRLCHLIKFTICTRKKKRRRGGPDEKKKEENKPP